MQYSLRRAVVRDGLVADHHLGHTARLTQVKEGHASVVEQMVMVLFAGSAFRSVLGIAQPARAPGRRAGRGDLPRQGHSYRGRWTSCSIDPGDGSAKAQRVPVERR